MFTFLQSTDRTNTRSLSNKIGSTFKIRMRFKFWECKYSNGLNFLRLQAYPNVDFGFRNKFFGPSYPPT